MIGLERLPRNDIWQLGGNESRDRIRTTNTWYCWLIHRTKMATTQLLRLPLNGLRSFYDLSSHIYQGTP